MVNDPTERSNPVTAPHPASEATRIWLASLALVGVAGLVARAVPLVADNLLAIVAAVFLYLPAWVVWRRGLELDAYGLSVRPVGLSLLLFVLAAVITLPPHAVGYRLWEGWQGDDPPAARADRLWRLDDDFDGRPALEALAPGVHAWQEGGRIVVLNADTQPVEVTVTATTADGDAAMADARDVALDQGRLLRRRVRAVEGSSATLSLGPGRGLSWAADPVHELTIEGADPVLVGRWSLPKSAPYSGSRSVWWLLTLFVTQLILVAIPEEWFYRGYLQARFAEHFGARWRILGADLGWGWIVASACFAAGHLVLDPRPVRLATFFPGLLFGWMRARTGSIAAAALFHALCNVWIRALGYVFGV